MNDKTEWLKARRSGIGGSDIAAILGLSPWATPLDVYESKVATDEPQDAGNEAMRWGQLLEDVVAREYAERAGVRVQRVNTMLRHSERPWAIGNIDRAIVAEGTRARVDASGRLHGAERLLEVKTVGAYSAADWGGDDGTTVPAYYEAQGMWYLGVTGLEVIEFAALVGGQKLITRRVERDDEVLRAMFDAAEQFWRAHVEARVPPPPRTAHDAARLFKRDDGTLIDIGNDADALSQVLELRNVREQIAGLEAREEQLVDALKLRIGPASGLSLDGRAVVTWKAAKDSERTDWRAACEAMRASVPEWGALVARHTATVPGSRRFLVKD